MPQQHSLIRRGLDVGRQAVVEVQPQDTRAEAVPPDKGRRLCQEVARLPAAKLEREHEQCWRGGAATRFRSQDVGFDIRECDTAGWAAGLVNSLDPGQNLPTQLELVFLSRHMPGSIRSGLREAAECGPDFRHKGSQLCRARL